MRVVNAVVNDIISSDLCSDNHADAMSLMQCQTRTALELSRTRRSADDRYYYETPEFDSVHAECIFTHISHEQVWAGFCPQIQGVNLYAYRKICQLLPPLSVSAPKKAVRINTWHQTLLNKGLAALAIVNSVSCRQQSARRHIVWSVKLDMSWYVSGQTDEGGRQRDTVRVTFL